MGLSPAFLKGRASNIRCITVCLCFHILILVFYAIIACRELGEAMQNRLTANRQVQKQIRQKMARGETRVSQPPKVVPASRGILLLQLFLVD